MERLEGSNVWDILFVCSRGRLAGQKKLGSCLSICGSPPARHPPQKHQVHWLMSWNIWWYDCRGEDHFFSRLFAMLAECFVSSGQFQDQDPQNVWPTHPLYPEPAHNIVMFPLYTWSISTPALVEFRRRISRAVLSGLKERSWQAEFWGKTESAANTEICLLKD